MDEEQPFSEDLLGQKKVEEITSAEPTQPTTSESQKSNEGFVKKTVFDDEEEEQLLQNEQEQEVSPKRKNSRESFLNQKDTSGYNLKNYSNIMSSVKHVREPTDLVGILGDETTFISSSSTQLEKLQIPAQPSFFRKILVYLGLVEQRESRLLYIQPNSDETSNHRWFHTNKISTTKYTWWSFLPKNLFEQFAYRHANIYFAFIAILCLIPDVSPIGTWGSLFTIIWVVGIQMLKDIVEDVLKRYSDFIINHIKVEVFDKNSATWKMKFWENVKVGDLVRIYNKHTFPADLLFIDTSDVAGSCFVETASLDGETDLKHKQAIENLYLKFQKEKKYEILHGKVACDAPNRNLYEFKGNLDADDGVVSLNVDNVLLRGSVLRNTDWIVGAVCYTGHDTKIMKNSSKAPSKKSQTDKKTNRYVYMMFGIEMLMCWISVTALGIWTGIAGANNWYLGFTSDFFTADNFSFYLFKIFWTFMILYSNLIPISLYVSVEFAKVLQGYFIARDLGMFYTEENKRAIVKTSGINEDLGQVQIIFSDKTGTLTANVMKFFKCSITGKAYGKGITEISKAEAKKNGKTIDDPRPDEFQGTAPLQFWDDRWLNDKWKTQENSNDILRFMKFAALCHTVIIEEKDGEKMLSASSPDELALVDGMKNLGIEFSYRDLSTIHLTIEGKNEIYEILEVIEFNSDRKRMTMVLRTPEDKVIVFCKGADSVLWPLMKESPYKEATENNIQIFADEGLRTLLLGQVEIPNDVWENLSEEMSKARKIMDKEESKEAMRIVALKIEKDLELVGATALEDKLQEGVPDTIAELKKANIRIWVLTGDKLDTAENIGHACDLLNSKTYKHRFKDSNCDSVEKLEILLNDALEKSKTITNQGLLIEGKTALQLVLKNDVLKKLFLSLAVNCEAVLCCRVSPIQKAKVVELVNSRVRKGVVTLAIGDGGNDVSMIQSARVGVGISGKEGQQAANAADYAFGQFRFLKRLLLVHGRWSYRRVSKLILYSFYKNCVLYLTQFWYFFFNAYSGQSLHDTWNISFFNTIFTALPIMAIAIFDRDLTDEKAEKYPNVYTQGHYSTYFNFRVFLGYIANSIFHSFVCFIFPYYLLSNVVSTPGVSEIQMGFTIFTCVLFVVTIKVALETASYTILNWTVLFVSIGSWFGYYMIYTNLYRLVYLLGLQEISVLEDIYQPLEAYQIMGNWIFWLTLFVTCAIALIRDIAWKFMNRLFSTGSYYQIIGLKEGEIEHTTFPLRKSPPLKLRDIKILEETKKVIAELKENANALTESKISEENIPQPYTGFTFDFGENSNVQIQKYFRNKKKYLARKEKIYKKNGIDLLSTPVKPTENVDNIVETIPIEETKELEMNEEIEMKDIKE